MNYLADTSVLSRMMAAETSVLDRIERLPTTDLLFTSVITEAEIEYGLLSVGEARSRQWREAANTIFDALVEILPITREVARAHAAVKLSLIRAGRPIPENDMWIAAVAIANRMTLLHRDKQFAFVPGLAHEDWSEAL